MIIGKNNKFIFKFNLTMKFKLMKTPILYFFALILLFFSCGKSEKEKAEEQRIKDSLNQSNQHLSGELIQKDSTIGSFIHSFNVIQDNLDEIKKKENIITSISKDSDVKSKEDQIVSDIQSIYELIAQNKLRISKMSSKLKNANIKIEELQKIIERLNNQLIEKDTEIAELKKSLEQKDVELSNIKTTLNETKQESDLKTSKLNTAYYVIGNTKELIKENILTKDGGFIGIGKETKMKDNFNTSYFTKVDITNCKEIILSCKKAKIMSTNPSASYQFEGTQGKGISKLIILDPTVFWSTTKYLVIITE